MRKVFLLSIVIGISNLFKSQALTIKLNNKTGYNINAIEFACKYIGLLNKDSSIIINDCNELNTYYSGPFGPKNGYIKGKGKSIKTPIPLCGTSSGETQKITQGKFEYDILFFEDEKGYSLFYKQVPIREIISTHAFAGTYLPINKEGDQIAAICNEGVLKINEDNTFNYLFTADKNWCPTIKALNYEGSYEEKDDTLFLYNKGFKTITEPRFSIMDVDTGKNISISLFSDTGEPIEIEKANSINSAQGSGNFNKLNIPFKKNQIEINDKRIFGLTIFPIGYPEVQIVLKKVTASAKINVILSSTFYDSVFNGRKFVFEKNILSEVGGNNNFTSQYIKK